MSRVLHGKIEKLAVGQAGPRWRIGKPGTSRRLRSELPVPDWSVDLLMALGTWHLELAAWHLELGAWSLELGAWNLELGTARTSVLSKFTRTAAIAKRH
jgi:hypothetical protein